MQVERTNWLNKHEVWEVVEFYVSQSGNFFYFTTRPRAILKNDKGELDDASILTLKIIEE